MKRDERRKATAVYTNEGRVVDGVHRVWMQGGAVIILHLCCQGRIVSYCDVHKDGGTMKSIVINGPPGRIEHQRMRRTTRGRSST